MSCPSFSRKCGLVWKIKCASLDMYNKISFHQVCEKFKRFTAECTKVAVSKEIIFISLFGNINQISKNMSTVFACLQHLLKLNQTHEL